MYETFNRFTDAQSVLDKLVTSIVHTYRSICHACIRFIHEKNVSLTSWKDNFKYFSGYQAKRTRGKQ